MKLKPGVPFMLVQLVGLLALQAFCFYMAGVL